MPEQTLLSDCCLPAFLLCLHFLSHALANAGLEKVLDAVDPYPLALLARLGQVRLRTDPRELGGGALGLST